ncbi:MAG: TonB-dependent receptor [Gammaproteobacteria bacterium]
MSLTRSNSFSTLEKAREVNLDTDSYGTFAEIGAGQEVVRWFFRAGGAAGTVSKSISAYDMQVSDAIYGDCKRYVSRERLDAMLEREQQLNRERLSEQRGQSSSFFAFADTVSARNYLGTNECHGWMGVRFQTSPGSADSVIIIHVRMLDPNNSAQQEALGIVGVNLIHGACRYHNDINLLVASLVDGLSEGRVEVDMVDVSGPAFSDVDNRVLTLKLVQLGLTGAAMFSADGQVLQPSNVLRKKHLLVQRGRFRPITHVNMDMLASAHKTFETLCDKEQGDILPIMEISMHNLRENSEVCLEDFVSRAELISTTGCVVMVSDFQEYHRLATYLSRYTDRQIGLAMGLASLQGLFDESYYDDLAGGILESFGRLFKSQIKLLIYPYKNASTHVVETLDGLDLPDSRQHLLEYLRARHFVTELRDVSHEYLDIHSPEVLKLISSGSQEWTEMVPESVATIIKEKNLFGYSSRATNPSDSDHHYRTTSAES